jgi:hypothetical protein
MNDSTNPTLRAATTRLRRLRRFLAEACADAEGQPTPALRGYPFSER